MNSPPAKPQPLPFSGFYIGSVLTALVLSAGILAFVYALRDVLAAIMIAGINFVVRRTLRDTLPIQQVHVAWQVQASFAVAGSILLSIGLRLAFWVHATANTSRR
jgi:uncharacterized membrane protein